MQRRPLGNTGLHVSAISLGTVELGTDYGIQAPGEYGRPSDAEAIDVILEAVRRGINFIDTAPTYGDSERLIGRALSQLDATAVVISTKVVPATRVAVEESLDKSRVALKRDVLDIVQLHNATPETIADPAFTGELLDAQQKGVVRFIGATVYGEEAALAVIESRRFQLVQVAYSLLDQRMARRVFARAHQAGLGVVVRSALLKGALTPKARFLPAEMAALTSAATGARDALAGGDWTRLPEVALRFCLSAETVSSVLTGIRTDAELEAAFAAEGKGPLSFEDQVTARQLGVTDEDLIDPRHWTSIP